jgi:hypothetical protein
MADSASPPSKKPKIAAPGDERSFVCVKPDGVQRGLIAEVMGRLEKKGFRLLGKLRRTNPFFSECLNLPITLICPQRY